MLLGPREAPLHAGGLLVARGEAPTRRVLPLLLVCEPGTRGELMSFPPQRYARIEAMRIDVWRLAFRRARHRVALTSCCKRYVSHASKS